MECYNYNCPFRTIQLPTSVTRCDCVACPNRSAKTDYIVSNRTLSKEKLDELEKKKMDEDWNYGLGVWC